MGKVGTNKYKKKRQVNADNRGKQGKEIKMDIKEITNVRNDKETNNTTEKNKSDFLYHA
jgi:hypothetical protein